LPRPEARGRGNFVAWGVGVPRWFCLASSYGTETCGRRICVALGALSSLARWRYGKFETIAVLIGRPVRGLPTFLPPESTAIQKRTELWRSGRRLQCCLNRNRFGFAGWRISLLPSPGAHRNVASFLRLERGQLEVDYIAPPTGARTAPPAVRTTTTTQQ